MYGSSPTPFFSLRREIDRLFEDAIGGRDSSRNTWMPVVDVRESERDLVLAFELPGVKPENVEITAENGVLTVSGEKREERKEGEQSRYHLVERTYGAFSRSFQLPQGIDDEQIEAEYEGGVLRVRIPKAERAQPRRIQVQSGGAGRSGGRSQQVEVGTGESTGKRGQGGRESEHARAASSRGSEGESGAEKGRTSTGARGEGARRGGGEEGLDDARVAKGGSESGGGGSKRGR